MKFDLVTIMLSILLILSIVHWVIIIYESGYRCFPSCFYFMFVGVLVVALISHTFNIDLGLGYI